MSLRQTSLFLATVLVATSLAGCGSPGDAGTPTGATPTPTATPTGAPSANADFGDAPDNAPTGYAAPFAQTGNFPTKLASDGARATDLTQARLGAQATAENDALAQDADDGIVEMVLVLTQLPPPAALTVNVSGPAGSAGGTYHVNVLFDQNLDGEWSGAEWVVRNHGVEVEAGETQTVALPPFPMTQSLILPDGAWLRIALTKEQAPAGWTGAGAFSAGEIEDHVVAFPKVGGKHPAIAVMDCVPKKTDFDGKATAVVTCTISNNAPLGHGDQIEWSLTRHTGGVTIDGKAELSGTEKIAPGANIVMVLEAANIDPLPSRWTYRAVGIDPPSKVTATGVEIGHGESEGEIEFLETAKACTMLVAEIETSREHRAGESDAIFWVFVKKYFDDRIEEGVANARVIGEVKGEAVEATTDGEGRAEIRHTVYEYGEYPLIVEDVQAEGCEFDGERSKLQATASVR